jgi:hypothetical protein
MEWDNKKKDIQKMIMIENENIDYNVLDLNFFLLLKIIFYIKFLKNNPK